MSDDMYERGVPIGALNLSPAGYPDHGRYGDVPPQGKIPTAESGIEPWNLMANSQKFWPPSHEAGHMKCIRCKLLLSILKPEAGKMFGIKAYSMHLHGAFNLQPDSH
jgi:hypothetical protein